MDAEAKKTALRMIPYGLYILTAEAPDGSCGAATVNWVTQASFDPPLVAVGVKADSAIHGVIDTAGAFALNVLGKGQEGLAFGFFKPAARAEGTIGGQACRKGTTGALLLDVAPAHVECKVVHKVAQGDHSLFIGEVVAAGVQTPPSGRADEATLWLRDLGEKVFYGG